MKRETAAGFQVLLPDQIQCLEIGNAIQITSGLNVEVVESSFILEEVMLKNYVGAYL